MKYIKQIKEHLGQSFPYLHKKWIAVVVPSIFIFLIILMLKPILKLDYHEFFWKISLAMTLISVCCAAFVVYVSPLIFPKYHNLENWNKWKFLSIAISIILLIAIFNSIYINKIHQQTGFTFNLSFLKTLIMWCLVSSFFGIIPTSIIYLLTKRFARNDDPYYTTAIIEQPQTSGPNERDEKIVLLKGNTKEQLALSIHRFLYAEAVGNYVAIYYMQEGKTERKLLRITIAQLLESLKAYTQIARCHRAYVINLAKVLGIQGNSKNAYLMINKATPEIPVSRNYIKSIREQIEK